MIRRNFLLSLLFSAAALVFFTVAPPSFGQSQTPTQKEAYECDDKVETGGPPGMDRRVQRRMDRQDAKTDCVPKGEAATKSGSSTQGAAGTTSAAQQDKATVDLCNELADRKKLSGNDRQTFVRQCVSTSATPAPASTTSSQKDETQLCNELADRKNLTGNDRKNFVSQCVSAGGTSTSTSATDVDQDQLQRCNELADRKNLRGNSRTNFVNTCMSAQGSTAESGSGSARQTPSSGRHRGVR